MSTTLRDILDVRQIRYFRDDIMWPGGVLFVSAGMRKWDKQVGLCMSDVCFITVNTAGLK